MFLFAIMVAINSTCSMVIGGFNFGLNWWDISSYASTYFYDHNEKEWINGPNLIQAIYDHAAGIVTDEVSGEDFVAVTGGYHNDYLDSTEILQDGEWVKGKISNTICLLLEIFWNLWRRSRPKIWPKEGQNFSKSKKFKILSEDKKNYSKITTFC